MTESTTTTHHELTHYPIASQLGSSVHAGIGVFRCCDMRTAAGPFVRGVPHDASFQAAERAELPTCPTCRSYALEQLARRAEEHYAGGCLDDLCPLCYQATEPTKPCGCTEPE